MKLTGTQERFILHWGEMGSKWGINRTVAMIHALLYISPDPLPADEIAETLAVARSNVSVSLKELQGWGIVRGRRLFGDRREHFESMADVWEMFRVILDERKRREIDPTVDLLADCLEDLAESNDPADKGTADRLSELHAFLEAMCQCYQQLHRLPAPVLRTLVTNSARIESLVHRATKEES